MMFEHLHRVGGRRLPEARDNNLVADNVAFLLLLSVSKMVHGSKARKQ